MITDDTVQMNNDADEMQRVRKLGKTVRTIGKVLNWSIFLGSTAFALLHDPQYFANTGWGYGMAAAYGVTNRLTFGVGRNIGVKIGTALSKEEQGANVFVGNAIMCAAIGGIAATAWLAPKAYDKAKELREPYKNNAHHTTYAPSKIHAEKIAAAASWQGGLPLQAPQPS